MVEWWVPLVVAFISVLLGWGLDYFSAKRSEESRRRFERQLNREAFIKD